MQETWLKENTQIQKGLLDGSGTEGVLQPYIKLNNTMEYET